MNDENYLYGKAVEEIDELFTLSGYLFARKENGD